MNIVICEDDSIFRKELELIIVKILLKNKLKSEIILSSGNVNNVLDYINSNIEKTFYFLDVKMEDEQSGIDIAKTIRRKDWLSTIVFISSYAEKSTLTYEYKLEAMDYIIKGCNNLVDKVEECLLLSESRQAQTRSECIYIETKCSKTNIRFDDIYYFETSKSSHIITVYCTNGQYEFYKNLKDIIVELDDSFCLCHKSYIVNTNKIKSVNLKAKTLFLEDDLQCPVSKLYYEDLKNKLQNKVLTT